jgi:hypothetical protein
MYGFITARPRFHAVHIAHKRSLHCVFLRKIARCAHLEEPDEQGRASAFSRVIGNCLISAFRFEANGTHKVQFPMTNCGKQAAEPLCTSENSDAM